MPTRPRPQPGGVDQACCHWIAVDIVEGAFKLANVAANVIVEPALPYRTRPTNLPAHRAGRLRLDAVHDSRDGMRLMSRDQRVPVIRHHDVGVETPVPASGHGAEGREDRLRDYRQLLPSPPPAHVTRDEVWDIMGYDASIPGHQAAPDPPLASRQSARGRLHTHLQHSRSLPLRKQGWGSPPIAPTPQLVPVSLPSHQRLIMAQSR